MCSPVIKDTTTVKGQVSNMEEQLVPQAKLIEVDLDKEMRKRFLEYSVSVLVARALPDVRDGLKPVHRRILYTMYESGLMIGRAHV